MAGQEQDDAARERLLRRLLTSSPGSDVRLIAVGGDGVPAPLPPDVPVPGGVLVGRGKLGETIRYVVPEDQVAVVDAWLEMLERGVSRTSARLLDDPHRPVDLHLVDWRHRSDVVLAVMVRAPRDDAADVPGAARPQPPEAAPGLRPRVGALYLDNLSAPLDADAASARMLGRSVSTLVGARLLDLVHPDDTEPAIARWMGLLGDGPEAYRRMRLRLRTGTGEWLWCDITLHNVLHDPARPCVAAELVDVSREVAATKALGEKDRLLHRITEALPVGVAHIGPDREVAYRNRRLDEMLGPTGGTCLDDYLQAVRPVDGAEIAHAVEAVLAGEGDVELEVQLRPGHGALHCNVTIGGLIGADGSRIGAIVCVSDVSDSVRLRAQLEQRATYDALTGCLNRGGTLARLGDLLAHAAPSAGVAVVFVDLDDFKQINDRHGHAVGDRALRAFAAVLRSAARTEDVVGRLGGDEFLVVCPRIAGPAAAHAVAERLEAALAAAAVDVDGIELPLGSSLGVTWSPGAEEPQDVVARADSRMYDSKRRPERPAASG